MTKKQFDRFNKDVEAILVKAGATIVSKTDNIVEFALPTYYNKDAMFSLHTEFMRGDTVFSIYGNTNHYDSNLGNLFGITYYNNKINIHEFTEIDAYKKLEKYIRFLQVKPIE
jgi:hypothetical protein